MASHLRHRTKKAEPTSSTWMSFEPQKGHGSNLTGLVRVGISQSCHGESKEAIVNRTAEKVGGLNDVVAGGSRKGIALGPLRCPIRVTRLLVTDAAAPYFYIEGATLASDAAEPLLTNAGAPGAAFNARNGGGAFPLPPARAGDTIVVWVQNIDAAMHSFHGALIGVDPDER